MNCIFCGKYLHKAERRFRIRCPQCCETCYLPAEKHVGKTIERGGYSITLKQCRNLRIVKTYQVFQHESFHNPELHAFAARWGLRGVIAGITDEFKAQVALMHACRHEKWPRRVSQEELARTGFWPVGAYDNYWFCTHFAFFFVTAATSLGWTARIVNIDTEPADDRKGHMIADIWSNQLQKWIIFDPMADIYYVRVDDPRVPLSAAEIRLAHLKGKAGSILASCGSNEKKLPLKNRRLVPADKLGRGSSRFFWAVTYMTNNFMSEPYFHRSSRLLLLQDRYNRAKTWMTGDRPVSYYDEGMMRPVERMEDIYYTLNNTQLYLSVTRSNRLLVKADTFSPNFKTFRIRTGRGDWADWNGTLDLSEQTGRCTLEAQTENFFGVAGAVSKLAFNIEKKRNW